MTKISTPQEDITILKLHITNKIASNHINQKLIEPQREILSHSGRFQHISLNS